VRLQEDRPKLDRFCGCFVSLHMTDFYVRVVCNGKHESEKAKRQSIIGVHWEYRRTSPLGIKVSLSHSDSRALSSRPTKYSTRYTTAW